MIRTWGKEQQPGRRKCIQLLKEEMSRERIGIIEGFPERLNALIAESGLNHSEIGEGVGRDRKAISGYRNGHCVPDAVVLMKMCAVLKTTPNYLILGRE